MSDRVAFNHVEVICEGYEYSEDDYILLGSCGLEFTLDYIDPHDYHHNSYFKHMDEHEKELHHERVRSEADSKMKPGEVHGFLERSLESMVGYISNYILTIVAFVVMVLFSYVLVRLFAGNSTSWSVIRKHRQGSTYGPLTSAVLSTKKAC